MLALQGFWLFAALAIVYFIGVFTSQWMKDKISGTPASLRTALHVTESAALKELAAARDRLVAETATLLSRGKAAVAAEVKVVDLKATPSGEDIAAAAVIATDPPVVVETVKPASPSSSAASA